MFLVITKHKTIAFGPRITVEPETLKVEHVASGQMDVDGDASALEGLPDFDLSPAKFPWRSENVDLILSRRRYLEDELFIDRLLSIAGVDSALYPPTNVASFRRLLNAIQACNWDTLKRSCIVYYLLKWWIDGRDIQYAERQRIPPHFVGLADAYYCLDIGHIQSAVNHLCDARIKPDDTLKIMKTIALTNDAMTAHLIIRYVRMAKPVLAHPDEQDVYIVSLCCVNFMDAWLYQRSFPASDDPSSTRHRLLHKILEFCFIPKPRANQLQIFLSFPMTKFEEKFLHSYALSPPPTISESALAILQDLITVRLVHQGQYITAVRLDRDFANEAAKGTRATGKITTQKAEERKLMLKDIIKALPAVQRNLLDTEFVDAAAMNLSSSTGSNGPLTMSWEDLDPNSDMATSSRLAPLISSRTPVRTRPSLSSLSSSPAQQSVSPWVRSGAPSASPTILTKNRHYLHTPTTGAPSPSFGASGSHTKLVQDTASFGTPVSSTRNAFFNPRDYGVSTPKGVAEPFFSSDRVGLGTSTTPNGGLLGRKLSFGPPSGHRQPLARTTSLQSDVTMDEGAITSPTGDLPMEKTMLDVQMIDDSEDDFVISGASSYDQFVTVDKHEGEEPQHSFTKPASPARKMDTSKFKSKPIFPSEISGQRHTTTQTTSRTARGLSITNNENDDVDVPGAFPPPVPRTTNQLRGHTARTAFSIPEESPLPDIVEDMPMSPTSRKTRQSATSRKSGARAAGRGRSALGDSDLHSEDDVPAPVVRRSSRLSAEPIDLPKTPRTARKSRTSATPTRVLPRRQKAVDE